MRSAVSHSQFQRKFFITGVTDVPWALRDYVEVQSTVVVVVVVKTKQHLTRETIGREDNHDFVATSTGSSSTQARCVERHAGVLLQFLVVP
jgi:hypothetical protein